MSSKGGLTSTDVHVRVARRETWLGSLSSVPSVRYGAGTSVRDRVGAVDGRLDIESVPGRGTTVRGVVPWPPRSL